jgi:hypothetical protein
LTLKLVIEKLEDIPKIRKKLTTVKLQFPEFLAVTVRDIGANLVLKRIHSRMRQAGFSEKIIRGTILSNIEILSKSKVRLHFKSEYFSETGFDVALAREKGTTKHKVEGNPLAFEINGQTVFATEAYPEGIIALEIIGTTLDQMGPEFKEEYAKRRDDWMRRNLGGDVIGI